MVKLVRDENIVEIEKISGELLEFNNSIIKISEFVDRNIEEVYDLHDKISKINSKTIGDTNNEKLYFISLISRESSVVRNRLIQIKLEMLKDLRKHEMLYKRFYDRLIQIVDGNNAEIRQAKANGYLVTFYDIIIKLKNLLENIDIALNDLSSLHSSLKLQFFVIKTDLELSTEGEEEITF